MTVPILNPRSGEVIHAVDARALLAAAGIDEPRESPTVELARFADKARELQSIADEARNVVSDELVRRLDQDGCWTWRDGGFEVKAPSPSVGTSQYHTGLLRDALVTLVGDGVISPTAANSAVALREHTVSVSYELLRDVLGLLDERFEGNDVVAEIVNLLRDEPPPSYYQRPIGIRNLLKIPAAREAVEACQIRATPPPRTAKVRRLPT